jgi:MFS family permease
MTVDALPPGISPTGTHASGRPMLGLRANWRQFWLLVLVNAFVGAMVGLERTVLPLLAEREFGLASKSAALSFIATFGVVKAFTNFFAGRLGDRFGRKRVLVAGWLVGLPVPFLVIWAPTWAWIVAANVLLGVNQGLAWSTTVIMKIDLVGSRQRGFAMGLNEFAGYLAVAGSALGTGLVAERFGLRPEPFYIGIAVAALGLTLSILFVRDTTRHVMHESSMQHSVTGQNAPTTRELVLDASWRKPALFSASQAGLVNNLNDGLAWGLFPLFFAASGLSIREIALLAFAYPATWGLAQLWTGALSDRWGRKWLIVGGMLLQGAALLTMPIVHGLKPWIGTAVLLGLGTAMVYPTLLAAVGDVAHPSWRATSVGIYRFWRDLGYALGALLAGVLADLFGMSTALAAIGALTAGSGLLVAVRMPETLMGGRSEQQSKAPRDDECTAPDQIEIDPHPAQKPKTELVVNDHRDHARHK